MTVDGEEGGTVVRREITSEIMMGKVIREGGELFGFWFGGWTFRALG